MIDQRHRVSTRSRGTLAKQRDDLQLIRSNLPTFSSPSPPPLVNARTPGDDCDSATPHDPTFRPGLSFVLTNLLRSISVLSGDVVRIKALLSNRYALIFSE
jgi:hypothetical protein